MAYEIVLIAHIIGACVTGVVAAYASVAMWNDFSDKYRLCATILGSLAAFEIVSGTALSVLSLQVSAASLCSRIFLYLAIVAIVELLLFARMKKVSVTFPISLVTSPIAASLILFSGALALGF